MDLEFSEEQEMLREMVRGVCSEHSNSEVVRAMEDDPKGYPDELWKQFAELGLTGILIPEEYGGSGMGLLEATIAYEEFGRSLAPTPHFPSSVLSARSLLISGSEEQKQEWLPQIASGDAIFTPAWLEAGHGFGARGVQLRAREEGDDYVIDGTKLHVFFASSAARLVVLARTGDAEEDVSLLLVDPNTSGVTLTQLKSLASDTQYKVEFSGVRVPKTDKIGTWATWNEAMIDGIILCAAQATGGSAQALEMTCEFAKERHQFDKPLAAFQAISHYLADAATNVAGATTLVYEAAWARSEGKDDGKLAAMAKLFACQVYRDLTAMALQVHGGVGFTLEYDIQLFFRRAKSLQLNWWSDRHLEEIVASSVLDI